MARRPGPAPKDPENRLRRNKDPFVDSSGWAEIENVPYDGDIPDIPSWIDVSDTTREAYYEIAKLPQAQVWGDGTWLALHMGLMTVDRYLTGARGKGSSEAFKAIMSTLGAALRLTDDDLQRARIKLVEKQAEEEATEGNSGPIPDNVAAMADRRRRLA